jgi:predicted transcriptional regulator
MKPEPSLYDDMDQAAEDAADAGRLVPHEEVAAWLDTWGTPASKPAPASWFK